MRELLYWKYLSTTRFVRAGLSRILDLQIYCLKIESDLESELEEYSILFKIIFR